jgi:DNA-binding CsgD family transcriptional regulator
MDAATRQRHIEITLRHVQAAQCAVARQKALLERLPRGSRLYEEAERLLINFEDFSKLFAARLELLEQSASPPPPVPVPRIQAVVETPEDGMTLTAREREVLCWIAHGKTAAEVGIILGLSQRTVEAYIRDATEKLDTVNRVQAVVKALQLNLIQVERV